MGSVVAKRCPDILTKTYFSEEKSNAIGGINHCYQHFKWINGPWWSPSLWWSKRYQSCVGDSLPFLPSSPIYYHFIFPLEHDAEVKTNSGIHFQTSSYSTNPLKNLYCLEFLPLGGAGIHWKQLQFQCIFHLLWHSHVTWLIVLIGIEYWCTTSCHVLPK